MSNLTDFCGLWKRTAKSGTVYFTGKLNGNDIVRFLNTKQNAAKNRPYINVYRRDGDERIDIGRLWYHKAENGKQAYMSGKIADTDVVAFVNKLAAPENRQPAIRVYVRSEDPAPAPAPEKPKKGKKAAAPDDGDMPF